ncbi:MAG: hypothetical protein H0V73_10750 [Chloroflexi bacterium]|nr:hypothetical protein [Chloroflexota bacterium]
MTTLLRPADEQPQGLPLVLALAGAATVFVLIWFVAPSINWLARVGRSSLYHAIRPGAR